MTACQTPAQSLSATPLATSYPTTPFSLPPHATTKSLTYRPTLSIFSLYDKVLRRPVEPAVKIGQNWILPRDGLSASDPSTTSSGPLNDQIPGPYRLLVKPVRCLVLTP